MKVIKALAVGVVVATTLCAAVSFGQAQRAVLNAKQLGIVDLDLDLTLDEDIIEKTTPAVDAVEADAVVAEDGVEVADTPAEEVAEVADAITEDAVEADAIVQDVAFEDAVEVAPALEPVVEEALADEPIQVEAVPETLFDADIETVDPTDTEAVVNEIAADVETIEDVAVADVEDASQAEVLPEVVEDVGVQTATEAPAEDVGLRIADLLDDSKAIVDVEDNQDVIVPAVTDFDEALEVVHAVAEEPREAVDTLETPEVVSAVVEEPREAVEIQEATAEEIAVSELATLEVARRKLFDQHGRDSLAQGQAALLVGNWDRAIEKFREALRFLVERDVTIPYRKQAEEGLGEAYFRKATELRQMNNLDEAERVARESRQYQHPRADRLLTEIQNQRDNPPPPPLPTHEKRWVQPEYREMMVDIRERMKIAKEYYATGELSKCRGQVELILRDFPWYKDGVSMLRKVSIAEHKYVDNERVAAREQMIKDVTKAWSARTYGKDFSEGVGPTTGTGAPGEDLIKTGDMRILEKMRNIVIPEIDFRQANITDVVTFLSEASREHDRQDIPAEERGVNIVLNLGGASAPATPTATDPWAAAIAEPVASSGGVPPLTINARFLTLLGALEMIMDLADLKYRVRDNVVLIMEASRPDGELVHRMYNVLPSIQERVVQISSASSQGASAANPFALSAGETTETTDWKKFFGDLGVAWPDGSTCQYMSSIGKLVVKNTSRNLTTLEEVLAVLNVTPKQVEIEVRFVEVMQSDLDSLGFEWKLNDDWEIAEMKKDSHLPPASRRRLTMGAGSVTRGFNYLSANTSKDINDGNAVLDNVATFTSILTNPELSLVLHMLSSKQNTDLLSAPKVVAQAGFTATIKVVTEYIYPQEYNVEMLETTTGTSDTTSYSGAVVEPQNFVMREVGVILEVTPEVTPDGSMINLTLSPSVVSEPTWKNYGSTYPVSTATGTDLLGNQTYTTEYVQLPMEQPFFPVRSVATSVQIYNDATVVMGGMITEERYTNEDKIPFLGDIPFLGHLFRNKYEQSEKRNLLLFVTARLVDPAGRGVKDATASSVLPLGGMGN